MEIISYIANPSNTSSWHQQIASKDYFVTIRVESSNWLARILGRFIKVRITLDILKLFEGVISRVMIFNRVLSREEIEELCQHPEAEC